MPRALLSPDEIRTHQFVRVGWTSGRSFVLRCTAEGCDFQSPALYDDLDMANWKRRHLDVLERAKGARLDAERKTRSNRQGVQSWREHVDGTKASRTQERPEKAQAGVREAVRGGEAVSGQVGSAKPGRRRRRRRSEEVRQEEDGAAGSSGPAPRRPKTSWRPS